jgi:AraC-like DNA-binding protein
LSVPAPVTVALDRPDRDCGRLVYSCAAAGAHVVAASRVHYAETMVTALARPTPLERVLYQSAQVIEADGHVVTKSPDLCFYRFSRPTTFTKGESFGVTLGAVLQGTKHVRLGDRALVADPSRLLVITRETDMHVEVTTATPERPYIGLSLCFSPEQVAKALIALAEAGAPAPPDPLPGFVMPIDEDVADALYRLLRTLADPLDRKLVAPLVIDEILYRLLRSDAAATMRAGVGTAADAHRILESMQYIRANHTRKLDVNTVARAVAMSPSHFAHRFSAIARISPMRYLREVRLDRARSLLFTAGARAGEVGLQVGFETAAHFTREFKRRYGAAPSHYLRQHALH